MDRIQGYYAMIHHKENKIVIEVDSYGDWILIEGDKIIIDQAIHIIVMKKTDQNTYTPDKEIIVKHIDLA